MKSLRHLVLAGLLLLTMFVVSAQELTETTTMGAITVQHPANYSAEAITDFGIGLIDETENFAIIVLNDDAIAEMNLPEVLSASDFVNALSENFDLTGEPSPISLAGAEGFVVEGGVPSINAKGLIYALNGENGLFVALALVRQGEVTESFRELGERVIDTIIIDPSAVVQTVSPTATVVPDGTDEPTGDEDVEACPLKLKDMPENTLIFCLGVQMTYPEGWQMAYEMQDIDSYVTLSTDNYEVTLTTTVNEISQYYNPESYWTDVVVYSAEMTGHEGFDPAEHVKTTVDEVGRKVQVYNASDFVELAEDDVHQLVYIITLNNDLFVTHTFTWVPEFFTDMEKTEAEMEKIEAEMEKIALSTTLTEDYEGIPSYIEIDGETVFVFEAMAYDSSYSFSFSDDQTHFIVTCPAEMVGDEATVWGTDIYTNDSSVCLAAAHAGVITLADGGMVKVTMLPGEEEYEGSKQNGVQSNAYGSWEQSFSVEAFAFPDADASADADEE